jgi:CBS domain-containing protein
METVKQLLLAKGSQAWTVSPDASVFEALKLLAAYDIGALLVTEGEQVVGILSERDYARKVVLEGKSSKDTLVSEIMTHKVFGIAPEHTVEDCMALMTEKHIRHLPVFENGRLAGVVSIGDIVKAIISEQGYLIDHLVNYITGGR